MCDTITLAYTNVSEVLEGVLDYAFDEIGLLEYRQKTDKIEIYGEY